MLPDLWTAQTDAPPTRSFSETAGQSKCERGGGRPPAMRDPPGGGRWVTPAVRPFLMGGTCSRAREDLPARREIGTPVRNPHRAFIAVPAGFGLPSSRHV